jgi:hypothetical protein
MMPPRWDSDAWRSPTGLAEDDDERCVAWCMRAGIQVPAWAAHDPRLDAAARLLCAALVEAPDALAERLRLMPCEEVERIDIPLARLRSLGIVLPLARGGWLLRPGPELPAPHRMDECGDEAIAIWFRGLDAASQATVAATLAEVVRRLGGAA